MGRVTIPRQGRKNGELATSVAALLEQMLGDSCFCRKLSEHRCGVTKVFYERNISPEPATEKLLWSLLSRFASSPAVEQCPPALLTALPGVPGAG